MPFRLPHIILLSLVFLCCERIKGQEEGLATYYHHRFDGRKSSSGRIYDNDELVAAHRTYPFGTFLRVTNLSNMKSVIVCVTDRGPRSRKRIIDLSRRAAELLDFISKGVARVRLEVVPGPLDLRYLDLIYPKIPYLNVKNLRSMPPYRIKFKQQNRR